MIQYRAAWILPITSPPIAHGWVVVDRQRIVAVGKARGAAGASETIDLGAVAIMPGLVNAHTHLELSWMRGRIGPRDRFTDWIQALLTLRREGREPGETAVKLAVEDAVREAARCGTALVGDISNTLITVAPLAAAGLPALVFNELIGFKVEDPEQRVRQARAAVDALPEHETVRTAIAAHAPYSVAPWLFRAIRDDLDRHPFARSSVHLAESTEEVEFLEGGTGPWREVLDAVGAWSPRWQPPQCPPAAYLDRLGFLDPRILAVHGVQLSWEELKRLAQVGTTLVTCPRGNVSTGAGPPPIDRFYAAGVKVAVGTDSLASVDDLNIFNELPWLRRFAPGVSAARLLESATRVGADALGFGADFGAIEPGRRARLLAIDVPAAESDVEEYLVRGILPDQIRWLPEHPAPGT